MAVWEAPPRARSAAHRVPARCRGVQQLKESLLRRVAVIDIGTNSTRLLVADVDDGNVEEVDRRTRVTRLGRGVDLSGNLATEAIEAVCEVVAEYVARL